MAYGTYPGTIITVVDNAPDIIHGDRRSMRRYESQLGLWFESTDAGVRRLGRGTTADFSRQALRFHTDEPPAVGTRLELHVAWPFLLQGVCELELLLRGQVTASSERGLILSIASYEFQTCGERSFAEPLPASMHSRVA